MSSNPPHLCKAYKSLDEKLKEQCKRYLLFHPNKQFGAFPGMYVEHHFYQDEKKPDERTSHYFRGGIISTMAIFEAFLIELLEEACTDERLDKNDKGKKLKGRFYESPTKRGKEDKGGEDFENIVLFHKWNKKYGIYLFKDSSNLLVDYLFRHPMEYSYVLDQNYKISLIKIGKKPLRKNFNLSERAEMRASREEQQGMEDESIICALLRLFWGIRCVMVHGDPTKTLERHALKGFPRCSDDCHGKSTQVVLNDAGDLELYCEKIIEAIGKNPLGRTIPEKKVLEQIEKDKKDCLEDKEWKDAYKILDIYFKTHSKAAEPSESDQPIEPPADHPVSDSPPRLSPFAAFFHMCRVDQWLRKNTIDMHITYCMLVRVNQFIHMLAFRLTIAMATILEEEYGLPSGSWGIQEPGRKGVTPITKDEIPNMIKQFEDRHKEMICRTKETNLTGQGEDEIKKICKKVQKMATEKLKENSNFMATDLDGVWRVVENEEKIDDECVIKTYLSVVKETVGKNSNSAVV